MATSPLPKSVDQFLRDHEVLMVGERERERERGVRESFYPCL